MQERREHIALDAPMRFAVRATSVGRFWNGLEAKIYETLGGTSQVGPVPYYCITMHLSAPIRSTCRTEGPAVSRLQVPGDIDLLPPGSYAAWTDEDEALMFGVGIHESLFRTAADSMGIDAARVIVPAHMQLRDPQIEHIAWALKAELESGEHLGRLYAESLGVALASQLLRRYARRRWAQAPSSISHQRMRRVLDYVHENLSQDVSLEEVAQVVGLSSSHLKVVFRKAMGMPVHQYIIRCRVEKAVQLLARGDLPLSEVASMVGFANQSHMARFIRRVTGESPAAIRGCIER